MLGRQFLVAAAIMSPLVAHAQATKVTVHGTFLVNAYRNSGFADRNLVPTISGPRPLRASGAASVSQSSIQIFARRDSVLGGRLIGEFDADLFGALGGTAGGRGNPDPRIRRVYVELQWSKLSLLVGQESPLVFGVDPLSVASRGTPLFTSAGNLFLWLPQARLTAQLATVGSVELGAQAAVIAPNRGPTYPVFFESDPADELGGPPSIEGRLMARWTRGGRAGEIGVGIHRGWVRNYSGRIQANAVGASAVVPFTSFLEIRGEAFSGDGTPGLGGATVALTEAAQTFTTRGVWGQLLILPTKNAELGVGIGIDDPSDGDFPPQQTLAVVRNQAISAAVTWRPSPIVVGFEARWIRTKTLASIANDTNTHLNLSFGVEF